MKEINYIGLTELAQKICKRKLDINKHKPNPLEYTFDRLKSRTGEEYAEFNAAYWKWHMYPTKTNKQELVDEIADCIDFFVFLAAKIDGYEKLIRE